MLLRFTVQKPKTVTSSDGKLTIPKTPTTARKPGQRNRVRNAKNHDYYIMIHATVE